jgi:hypothetical protein
LSHRGGWQASNREHGKCRKQKILLEFIFSALRLRECSRVEALSSAFDDFWNENGWLNN